MLKIIKLSALSLCAITISACSSFKLLDDISLLSTNDIKLCADDLGNFSDCQDMPSNTINKFNIPTANTDLRFTMLGEYTEQMAADLAKGVGGRQVNQAIVVASFVHLDSSLQNTDALGKQLAEYFINDLQKIGLPVSDHKLMGELDVNDRGDFAFSRDMEQLHNEVSIGYVLTGTMLSNSRGVTVNARIIDFKTNAIMASTSKFFPNLVVNGVL